MMLKKTLFFLFCFVLFVFAEESDKNPYEVNFNGNEIYSNFQLNEQLDLPEKFGQLDTTKQDFLMRLSAENIRALYYSKGYFSLNFNLDIRKQYFSQDSLLRRYMFSIFEGERYKFSNAKVISSGDSIEIKMTSLKTNQDRFFEQEDIAEDIQYILNAYRSKGYLHVYVNPTELIDTVEKKVYVQIEVTPGPKILMGNIKAHSSRVSGKNMQTTEEKGLTNLEWLASLWRIPQGSVIDGNQYNNFKDKLFSTQLFTQIRLSDSLRSDGLSNVHLDIKERIPGEARYGFFFEEIYGFGAQAYAKHKNFFGRFHEFSTSFQMAQFKQEVSLGYANPLLFGTSFSFIPTAIRFEDRLSFNHEKINPPAYPDSVEERYEVINRGDLTFGITENIRFRGTIDTRYVNKNSEKMFKFKGEIALTFDYTDDYFNPTKGIRVAPTTGVGTNLAASLGDPKMIGNPYTYAEGTINLYHPLFWTFFGAISGSCGKFFESALEDDARVFYQGGSRSVRGYRFRSIFASYESLDEEGEEVINTGLTPIYFRFNEEIRWTLPWKPLRNWQVVQFFDWAKIMDDDKIYETRSESSLGLGIRYKWQFLTFRLDYAFKKNLSDWSSFEDFAWGRFAFDLSQTF